eukprot:CAMPEP_0170623202 /NCGR_PEP_ID=MMETSP0224-20130122/29564_1 /TAXON_ID=285029 /ORGANISM="Togula jolla, Strain CCCM 725" /LENGTH=58 /DNA_ID=CAMNT_0010949623 /DNA_START=49 /DNA_END=221 /DNA_ORIENTATION=-
MAHKPSAKSASRRSSKARALTGGAIAPPLQGEAAPLLVLKVGTSSLMTSSSKGQRVQL